MNGKTHFRMMVAADLDEVLAIESDCYPTPWTAQQFKDELQNSVASILLCERETKIVGYICYWLIVDEMQILNVAVAPQARRNGIAEQLLNRAFSDCQQRGLTVAWLEVRAGNSGAITLYRNNGFRTDGVRRGYYRDGEDALLMVKEF